MKSDSKIVLIGTCHNTGIGPDSIMHHKAVPLFSDMFRNELKNTNETLLVVEGFPRKKVIGEHSFWCSYHADGKFIYTPKSRSYPEILAHLFGENHPKEINCPIVIADLRFHDYFYKFWTEKIQKCAQDLKKMDIITIPERFPKRKLQRSDLMELADFRYQESLSEIEIDYKKIAEQYFGTKFSFNWAKEDMFLPTTGKCDPVMISAVQRFSGMFQNIIAVAGFLHTTNIEKQTGWRHEIIFPENLKNPAYGITSEHTVTRTLTTLLMTSPEFWDNIEKHL